MIAYNQVLQSIFDHIKAMKDDDKSITAEKYLVAAIDIINAKLPLLISSSEMDAIRKVFEEHLPSAGDSLEDLRGYLLERVNKPGYPLIADIIYMQKQIKKASENAEGTGKTELDPCTLLTAIFETPNRYLNSYLESGSLDELNDSIEALFKQLWDNEESDEEKESESERPAEGVSFGPNSNNSKKTIAELTARVKDYQDKLSRVVFGQDNAITVFSQGFFRSELIALTDKERKRPAATFLFAGPPGVGKTFLAETVAALLDRPFKRYDMSEYCDKEASLEFIGSDAVYKNSKQGNFTEFVQKNPKSVILLDEIEKAHISIIHLFLQILDAGFIRDSKTDEEISLRDTVLIFTTNAGKQLYEDSDLTDFSCVSRKVILKSLQKDVNPITQEPYFPAAICSRFASGNVVMFNHLSVHNLWKIAKDKIGKHAAAIEKETGFKIDIDDKVYTSILFSEGGKVDARTISSRAETFLDDELFELLRLLSADRFTDGIEKLESVSINVDLPADNPEIMSMYVNESESKVLVAADDKTVETCRNTCENVSFIQADSEAGISAAFRDNEIGFAVIDIKADPASGKQFLNIEDEESKARDLFWVLRESYPSVPVLILQKKGEELNAEERISFLRQGVMGFINCTDDPSDLKRDIDEVCVRLHQQNSVAKLAKANKIISYETAQRLSEDGKHADITLFDFALSTAIDAEDAKNVLSNVSKPDVTFDDVIGGEEAKRELKYFVDYLKNPKKYMGTGVSAPKGVLLYGPPGTGKTMLAKAMANESDVTFISTEGNAFHKSYVGEGKDAVHDLFRTARKYAPSIVFVDEIEAIAMERGSESASSGIEATTTAFLTEMDGFKNDPNKPVFVLAATNFDVDGNSARKLDAAFMRRFDRRIYIDLPNREEREKYIRKQIKKRPLLQISDTKIESIVTRSTGMSLAQLESVIELALRMAIRDGDLKVTDSVFDEAFETFNGGESKKWNSDVLMRVARHEAGHAFICWRGGETPSYVTIVARADHGGYMRHDDAEDKPILTRAEVANLIRTSLGGRAAEIAYYGEEDGVSTGASSDLQSATYYALRMLCSYGMDKKHGLASVPIQTYLQNGMPDSILAAVNEILAKELQEAIDIINEGKPYIDKLVDHLLAKDHIYGAELNSLFDSVKQES